MEAQETNASKLSLLQRHREARELLVKLRQDSDGGRVRPQSASGATGAFGKSSAEASSSFRPRSAAPSTATRSEAATAAANVHFRPVPNPTWAPTPSAPSSAPRKRPLSALPSRVTTSHVGRNRPASACAGRPQLPSQGPDLLAFAAGRFGPAPPLPPLPPELDTVAAGWSLTVDQGYLAELLQLRSAASSWAKAAQLSFAGPFGVETNIFHFTCAINACETMADWSTALEILRNMEEREVLRNVVSCSSALSVCEKASAPMATGTGAVRLGDSPMVQLTSGAQNVVKWSDHDVVSYSSMISACAQGGQWQLAVQILKDMTRRRQAVATCSGVADPLSAESSAAQEWEVALQLVSAMLKQQVISACEKGSQWQLALSVLFTMPEALVDQELWLPLSSRNLYIPLLPNALVDLEMTAIAYNDWDEGTARLGRPVVAAFGGQQIQQAHDAEELESWLDQGLGHGGFIPEELTGALLAASHLEWTGQQNFAVEYSNCAHDVFCDRKTGLTCSGRPEVPLRILREKGVQVFIFHTGEAHTISMCEKLQETEPQLIHEKVDPSETSAKLVSVLKGKLQLQPLCYLLKPLTLAPVEFKEPLDLAVAHDVEVEDTNGKEKHRLGSLAKQRSSFWGGAAWLLTMISQYDGN
eukprot:Skav208539  [mRNA]  locus=scaffold1216:204962:236269:+ [translate_table: standard]